MMKNSGQDAAIERGDYTFHFNKLSYTGEPSDPATLEWIDKYFKVPACSMYGTTEIGVVLVNFPGAQDFMVKAGSLGKAVPGQKLEVQRADGSPCDPGETGELMLWRAPRGQEPGWMTTKDLAKIDEDGYFYHCGRADDVIISAGWTMSAVEIENTMLKHPDVKECAVIGAPDEARGLVVKAFVVTDRAASDEYVKELQDFTRQRLAQHEFPRIVEFTPELPKTPAGKVHRKVLRDREAAKAAAAN
jgi:acetyl-CoA synthetase